MEKLPDWLKRKKNLHELRELKIRLRQARLSTVCEEARCPNIAECFSKPTATFLIMGDSCTRNCGYCSVKSARPAALDPDEPANVAQAVRDLNLSHAVITSVTRDDLPDKGAGAFARTICAIRKTRPATSIEVLTPDFMGQTELLMKVLDAAPDVFNHNLETCDRLHAAVRPGADLDRSLNLLRAAKKAAPQIVTKSGFMVGLGETEAEIHEMLLQLRDSGCDIVTIGQYMRPTKAQIPVVRYWEPDKFEQWADLAKNIGISYVISGPLVRSSYHAKEALEGIMK